ncbi:MAG: alpha/beta hydrolase [Candidatus Nanopelagicales bacterium]
MRDLGSGPSVVLLHAFPVDHRLWDQVAPIVAGAGFRVLVPDYAGFGESAVPAAPPSVDAMADDLLHRLSERQVSQFCLAGLSMGGYAAMAILRTAGERVTGLGLVDTKMAADPDEARARRLAIADQVESTGSTDFLVDAMIGQLLGDHTRRERPEVVERVSGWIRSARPEAVAWAQRAMAGRPDSADTLAGYPGPALVLAGAEDTISPPAEQEAIASTLADADLGFIEGAGHLSAVEDPEAVAAALVDLAGRSLPA